MMRRTYSLRLAYFLALLCIVWILPAQGQDITNVRLVSFGWTNILDTYLSPEKYSGHEIRYTSHTTRENETRWKHIIMHEGGIAYVTNRSGSGNEMTGNYMFRYGIAYQVGTWPVLGGTASIDAACNADANLGFIYNSANTNNPAQAQASLAITPSIAAAYRFFIRQHPYALHYEIGMPLIGMMFSPNYGQSYYEIFTKGNYDHNIVATWPGNKPSFRQMLAADVTIKRTTLRVGYLGDYNQWNVNGLKSHHYTHAIMLGIVRKFQIIKKQP